MFTGLIQATGEVVSLRQEGGVAALTVKTEAVFEGLNIGESIAVNGACLTLTAVEGNVLNFQIMPQTLKLTNLGSLKNGDNVNLERSLRLESLVDGHLVTGHIDACGEITQIIKKDGQYDLRIRINREHIKYLALRASVAVDGVSLTVAELEGHYFVVCLIPATLKKTNLGQKKAGDRVNIECDILAKYTERIIKSQSPPKSKVTKTFLKEQGFV